MGSVGIWDVTTTLLALAQVRHPGWLIKGIWCFDSRYATAISTPVLNIYAVLILIRSLWVFFIRCHT